MGRIFTTDDGNVGELDLTRREFLNADGGNGTEESQEKKSKGKKEEEKKQILQIDPIRRCSIKCAIRGIGDGLLRNKYHAEEKEPKPPRKKKDPNIKAPAPKPKMTPEEVAALCNDIICKERNKLLEKRYNIKFDSALDVLYGFPSSGMKKGLINVLYRCTTADLDMKTAAYLWTITDPLVPILDSKWQRPADWELISMPVHNERNNTYIVGHRALFRDWGMVFELDFNADRIGLEMMITLIRHLGFIGIGSYTTARNGSYGRFELVEFSKPYYYQC